jgi:hypothetical protein
MSIHSLFTGALLFIGMLLCGCLYTTHQFNTGRTVPAGASSFTMGVGKQKYVEQSCPYIVKDSTSHSNPGGRYWGYLGSDGMCRYESEIYHFHIDSFPEPDTIIKKPVISKNSIPKISLGYRLGVRDKWGPFTGVDIGIHFEAPTLIASALFDMRLGLPPLPLRNVHHAVGIGFIIGAWADNGYFADYAISKILGEIEAYAHCRAIYHNTLITQLEEIIENYKIPHKQRWVGQLSTGAKWTLPEIRLIPDVLIPHIIATYPMVYSDLELEPTEDNPYRKKLEFKFNLGMGWNF